jgi:hypothetical protein
MTQLAHVSHLLDPATSYEAERQITDNGGRVSNMERVRRLVVAQAGLTGTEIGNRTGLGQHEAMRRLADLAHQRLVQQGPPRVPDGRRMKQVTWWERIEPTQMRLV